MNITDFLKGYRNHPILFVGAGFSMRYLSISYSWPALLEKISIDLTNSNELYKDLVRENSNKDGIIDLPKVATQLEQIFDATLKADRNGKFKNINDLYYNSEDTSSNISRFKIYLSQLVNITDLKLGVQDEISELVKASKNIASVITTNYDNFIESAIGYNPVIGNDILLSNPYGSVYKIHGCVSKPESIIITGDDYVHFDKKYELIRAQLLSLFIHNPIIFMGYRIGDPNIKKVLKTIFSYIPPRSKIAEKIKNNFLLIEREEGIDNLNVVSHDLEVEDAGLISINKIVTDNFSDIYKELAQLHLPVSVMDIRRAESVFGKIKEGGDIKVKLVGDLDTLRNDELVLAVGSVNSIKIHMQTPQEMMGNYFDLISNQESHVVELLDKFTINKRSYFPAYAFHKFSPGVKCLTSLMKNQKRLIASNYARLPKNQRIVEHTIEDIYAKHSDIDSKLQNIIFFNAHDGHISLEDLEKHVREFKDKSHTDYRKLLALYDYLAHNV
ncbi:SIR2 family protein [Klebsiella quasipneumoniae]|uniref:SIR2 family protein n=1 Tax=Klebsiella quasipneumoniae TaxID=1463165 RepID=UPI0018D8040E|nr:SIR2 family protein [Klebsiella quasipneumoniae]